MTNLLVLNKPLSAFGSRCKKSDVYAMLMLQPWAVPSTGMQDHGAKLRYDVKLLRSPGSTDRSIHHATAALVMRVIGLKAFASFITLRALSRVPSEMYKSVL